LPRRPDPLAEPAARTCGCGQTGLMTPAEVIDAFARAWNTENDAERLALLSAACLPDAVFVAPQGQTCGVEALRVDSTITTGL
jgi:hypothetical protein